MGVVKINNGRCEVYSDSGSYLRCFGCDVIDGDINSEGTVVVTKSNGMVEVYDKSGSYLRCISSGSTKAVTARWSGSDIAVRREGGRVEIYSSTGSYLRTI